MADRYGQRQIRNIGADASGTSNAISGPGGGVVGRGPDGNLRAYLGVAPTGAEKESGDLAFSRAETARLQAEAQARINANQHTQIGSAP